MCQLSQQLPTFGMSPVWVSTTATVTAAIISSPFEAAQCRQAHQWADHPGYHDCVSGGRSEALQASAHVSAQPWQGPEHPHAHV